MIPDLLAGAYSWYARRTRPHRGKGLRRAIVHCALHRQPFVLETTNRTCLELYLDWRARDAVSTYILDHGVWEPHVARPPDPGGLPGCAAPICLQILARHYYRGVRRALLQGSRGSKASSGVGP